MALFYGWGSTASRLDPLRGGSLLFTTKFLEKISKNIYLPRYIKFLQDLCSTGVKTNKFTGEFLVESSPRPS